MRVRIISPSAVVLILCVLLGSCSPARVPSNDDQAQTGLNFLRQKQTKAPQMLAPYEGELVLSESCLRIRGDDSGESYVAVWPFEFDYRTQGDRFEILDGEDGVVARVGDWVRVSGGEIRTPSPKLFDEVVIGTYGCPGKYWIVNSDVESLGQ